MNKRLNLTGTALDAFMQKAWDWSWANRYQPDERPYVSATDLHRRVRAAAAEILNKVSYGTYQWDCYMVANLRVSITLEDCRQWLYRQVNRGTIVAHHPGLRQGLSTGMRFRPAGVGLSEAEQKVVDTPPEERRRKRWIVHVKNEETKRPMCCKPLTERQRWSSYRRKPFHYTNEERPTPTCKKCLKLQPAAK